MRKIEEKEEYKQKSVKKEERLKGRKMGKLQRSNQAKELRPGKVNLHMRLGLVTVPWGVPCLALARVE